MLKPSKVRPIRYQDRIINNGGTDLGVEGVVLVETPTAKLVFLPGCQGYADWVHKSKYVPVRLVALRPSGKVRSIARGGRFDLMRYAKLLPTIMEELKVDLRIEDIDTQRRSFTTVFEEG